MLGNLHFFSWCLGDFNFYRRVIGCAGARDFTGVCFATLSMHQEQPIALQMSYLRPLHGHVAIDILHLDREYAGAEALDLAGKAVAIFHHDCVGVLLRVQAYGAKKDATENDGSNSHSASCLNAGFTAVT